MYEAAIKTASTGVYFAVPYMAKLIIEFMEKNYQKDHMLQGNMDKKERNLQNMVYN